MPVPGCWFLKRSASSARTACCRDVLEPKGAAARPQLAMDGPSSQASSQASGRRRTRGDYNSRSARTRTTTTTRPRQTRNEQVSGRRGCGRPGTARGSPQTAVGPPCRAPCGDWAGGREQGALRRWRERGRVLAWPAPGKGRLYLAGQVVGVDAARVEDPAGGVGLGGGPQQVLDVEVGAAPRRSLLGCPLQQLPRFGGEQPGQVHALHRTSRERVSAEDPTDQVVQGAAGDAERVERHLIPSCR